ncbi:MAG: hypothetical protein WD940_00340 [Patescibacteria group bacterium]
MDRQVLLVAILAVSCAMALIVAVLLANLTGLLQKIRAIRWPRRKPKGRKIAKRFAKQVLAGIVSEELQNYCTPADDSDRKCRNCKGGNPAPLWRLSATSKYFELERLTNAIWRAELCGDCIKALAEIVTAGKPALKPAPAPQANPVSQASSLPQSDAQTAAADAKKNDKDTGKGGSKLRKAIKFLWGIGVEIAIAGGAIALIAHLFSSGSLSDGSKYLYLLIGAALLAVLRKRLLPAKK